MARLQILELPEVFLGEASETPFVLVVDQYEPPPYPADVDDPDPYDNVAEKIGARAVLVFEGTVDIPANDTTAYLRGAVESGAETERDELHAELGLARGQLHSAALSAIRGKHANIHELIGRAEQAEAERNEARSWARHGYEIGQKHCSWSDHGVAPEWLTEGWPPHIDSCEYLQLAAQYDEALSRVRATPTEPEAMNADQERPDVWLHGYGIGVRAAKAALHPRNEPTVKPPDA